MNHDELMDYAADMLEQHGPEVDALTIVENAPWRLTQPEIDFIFEVIDGG